MVWRIWSGTGVLCALLAKTSFAIAKEEEPFGTPGQVAVTSGFAFGSESLLKNTGFSSGHDWFSIMPAVDVFVVPRLSVGARLGYSKNWPMSDENSVPDDVYSMTQDAVEIGPTLGYAFDLNERVSFWPNVGAGVGASWIHTTLSPNYRTTSVSVSGTAPLFFHAAPHFLLGFGPSLSRTWWSLEEIHWHSTRLAVNAFVGGSF